jgi:hypothetical protein
MIVPEQVKLPLRNTAAAHGADETALPPMMRSGSAGAAVAAAGMASAPVRAVAREATTMRIRTPGSFRGRVLNLVDIPYARFRAFDKAQLAPITV